MCLYVQPAPALASATLRAATCASVRESKCALECVRLRVQLRVHSCVRVRVRSRARLACATCMCESRVRIACAKCMCEVRVRSACAKCVCDFMKNIFHFVSARSCNLALPGNPPSVRRLASSLPPRLSSVGPFVGHRLRQHLERWPPTPRGTMGRKKGKAWRKAGKNREDSRKNEKRGKKRRK